MSGVLMSGVLVRRSVDERSCDWRGSGPDEDRVAAGVDDEGEPRGVPGLARLLASPGTGRAHRLAGEELLVELLHEDAGGLLANGPQAGDERGGTRVEKSPRKPADGGEQLAGTADLAGVEYDEGTVFVLHRPGRVLADGGGAEVLRLHGLATPAPLQQQLGIEDVVRVGCAVAGEVQQVELARPQQLADAGRGRCDGLGPELLLEEEPFVDGLGQREPRVAVVRTQRPGAAVAYAHLAGREAAELPAHEAALGQEAWLGRPWPVRRLEVHQLPGHERLV